VSGAALGGLVVAVTLLVIALSLAALVLPLLRRPSYLTAPALGEGSEGSAHGLMEEREAALAALRELDDDYAVGKLADADYHTVRERYERRALALLKAADVLGARATPSPPQAAPPLPPDTFVVEASRTRQALANGRADAPPTPYRNGHSVPDDAAHQEPRRVVRDAAVVSRPRADRTRRGRALALGTVALALVFMGGVAAVYFAGSRSQATQRPVATLDGATPRSLTLVAGPPARAFLAAANGLWTSVDVGATWQQALGLDGPLRAVAVSAARPYRLYAISPEAVAVSDDGGRAWTTRTVQPTAEAQDARPAGVMPAAPAAAQRPAGADRPVDLRALAVHPSDPERLWVVGEGAGVYRSDDAGRSWQRTSAQAPSNATALVVVAEPSGSGDVTRDESGTPTLRGLAGGLLYLASATDGVLASADDGRTWAPASGVVSGALPTRRVSSLAFDGTSGETAVTPDGRTLRGTLYAGTDEGIFRSVDRGQTWGRLPLAAAVAAVAAGGAPGDGLVLVADRNGRIYRSQNRGVTWDGS
jgi:photosystem II stability/assembly factor-like uncharacterized protein